MLIYRRNYFYASIFILAIEIIIAILLPQGFIRAYVGDFLIVIFIYCFIRAFFRVSVVISAISVLAFAFLVEWLQYLNLVKLLGLENSRVANIVIGNTFEWIDMLSYTLGITTVLIIEKVRKPHKQNEQLFN